jgi:hypothetical protein
LILVVDAKRLHDGDESENVVEEFTMLLVASLLLIFYCSLFIKSVLRGGKFLAKG